MTTLFASEVVPAESQIRTGAPSNELLMAAALERVFRKDEVALINRSLAGKTVVLYETPGKPSTRQIIRWGMEGFKCTVVKDGKEREVPIDACEAIRLASQTEGGRLGPAHNIIFFLREQLLQVGA